MSLIKVLDIYFSLFILHYVPELLAFKTWAVFFRTLYVNQTLQDISYCLID